MFDSLSQKLQSSFSKLVGKRRLTEENISEAVREVRLALLEADVHFAVVKNFIKRVKDEALGSELLRSVQPGQQFIKLVHDELVLLMGGHEAELDLSGKPTIFLLCGLQGSGKTTSCAKLARYLVKQGRRPLLVACDLQRPAAVDQLGILAKQAGVDFFSVPGEKRPAKVAKAALKEAKERGNDLLIVDTAGRLHVDEPLMRELRDLCDLLSPQEVLFVANGATGQDAVNSAVELGKRVGLTGTILTMLDGNTRGGAAISIVEVTGKPLKFEGVGEKLDDLQLFNPTSLADRVLGMGDTINLVKKVEEHIDAEEAEKLQQKLRKAAFTYEDYLKQMQAVKKMGSIKGLLKMLPLGQFADMLEGSEEHFVGIEAIILSMTPRERREEDDLTMSRRRRIARGSGRSIDQVNRLVKSFRQTKQFMKKMPNKKSLEKLVGGSAWR